jgi:hypothetical protein
MDRTNIYRKVYLCPRCDEEANAAHQQHLDGMVDYPPTIIMNDRAWTYYHPVVVAQGEG